MKSLSSIFLSVLLLGTLTGTLSSCSEKEDMSTSDVKITFSNPVISPSTRAPSVNPIFPQDQHFTVFAQWDKESFQSWGGPGSVLYMTGVETEYDPTSNGWVPTDTYLWPKQGKLTFSAFAPSSLTAVYGNKDVYGHSGLHIDGFTVPANGNLDVLYSKRSYNRTSSVSLGNQVSPYQGVDLVFQHALSQVRFTIKMIAKNETKVLKSMVLKGIHGQGNFDEWVIENPDGPADVYQTDDSFHRKWTLTGSANASYTIKENLTVTSEKQNLDFFILMPQRFAKGPGPQGNIIDAKKAKLVLTWNNGKTDTVNLNDVIIVWEPGKSYTYNLTIGSSKINFSPDISVDWLENPGIDVLPE